jgi:folate-dependent phosphoribosylglycinamide formyltransferase PurN
MKPKLIVFSSGLKDGGGSGFENLVNATERKLPLDSARDNSLPKSELDADIVAVVCNHAEGSVRERAGKLGIPFVYFAGPFDAEHYSSILQNTRIKKEELWVALSGWLKQVHGLNPQKTFNIHPALLSQLGGRFGGHGMYGKKVHEAVKAALDAGEISESGFTMHFVTDEMDRGPVFFEHQVSLKQGMSADDIERAVKVAELEWQPRITNMVVHGEIRWDGKDSASLKIPVLSD